MPPVTTWAPSVLDVRAATRTTILPVLRPLCSLRNASSCCVAMSKHCSGRLVAAAAPARAANRASTLRIHKGSSSMSASSAIAQYMVNGADAWRRSDVHMPRLPISSKAPRSPSVAKEALIKSSERLLSTVCDRPASKSRVVPVAKAALSRELHSASAPLARSCACL